MALGEHAVEIGQRRAGGDRRPASTSLMQQVVDLVMEDQRQAGDAQHQHEQRADQARPFMDPAPFAQGFDVIV